MTQPATIDASNETDSPSGPSAAGRRLAVPGATDRVEPVVAAALALLEQCGRFIGSVPDPAYTGPSNAMPGGTIGKHLRHTLDHYAALLVGVAEDRPVDYDHRSRDVPMESDRSAALAALAQVRRGLEAWSGPVLSSRVRIRVMLTSAGDEAVLESTVGRELAFATHHAVHHQAMMKTIAAEHGCPAPAGFGLAPATLHHDHAVARRA